MTPGAVQDGFGGRYQKKRPDMKNIHTTRAAEWKEQIKNTRTKTHKGAATAAAKKESERVAIEQVARDLPNVTPDNIIN